MTSLQFAIEAIVQPIGSRAPPPNAIQATTVRCFCSSEVNWGSSLSRSGGDERGRVVGHRHRRRLAIGPYVAGPNAGVGYEQVPEAVDAEVEPNDAPRGVLAHVVAALGVGRAQEQVVRLADHLVDRAELVGMRELDLLEGRREHLASAGGEIDPRHRLDATAQRAEVLVTELQVDSRSALAVEVDPPGAGIGADHHAPVDEMPVSRGSVEVRVEPASEPQREGDRRREIALDDEVRARLGHACQPNAIEAVENFLGLAGDEDAAEDVQPLAHAPARVDAAGEQQRARADRARARHHPASLDADGLAVADRLDSGGDAAGAGDPRALAAVDELDPPALGPGHVRHQHRRLAVVAAAVVAPPAADAADAVVVEVVGVDPGLAAAAQEDL